jgi:hypothetical protein
MHQANQPMHIIGSRGSTPQHPGKFDVLLTHIHEGIKKFKENLQIADVEIWHIALHKQNAVPLPKM